MSRENIKKSALKVKVRLNDSVADVIDQQIEKLDEKLSKLNAINTDNVEPMFWPDETPISFMREDEPGETLDRNIILKNAPETVGNFISLKKGGKND